MQFRLLCCDINFDTSLIKFYILNYIKFILRKFTKNYWFSNLPTSPRSKDDQQRKGTFLFKYVKFFCVISLNCNIIIYYVKATFLWRAIYFSRPLNVFLPGNADTMIDFECVPTYSKAMAAEIVSMNDNVIIPRTSFKSGTIEAFSFDYLIYR